MIFAIGDIHGRYDLLTQALDAIAAHASGQEHEIVFLGDYVDRGPQSKQVLDKLIELSTQDNVTCLRGNHEQLMLEAYTLRTRSEVRFWQDNGGEMAIESYGGEVGWGKPNYWPLIPSAHIRWIENLPYVVEKAGRVFVHAGFRPHVPLTEQDANTMMWIRGLFLNSEAGFPDWPHIVHGHTPYEEGKQDGLPLVLSWRTNLDSEAFASGNLAVGVFNGNGGGPSAIICCQATGSSTVDAVNFPRHGTLRLASIP